VSTLDRGNVKALLLSVRRRRETSRGVSAAPLSKNTLRLIRATLSVMLADAVEDGFARTNVAQGLSRRGRKHATAITPDERRKKIRPLSVEQLASFLATARMHSRDFALWLTLADTGARPGAALALKWDDFDLPGQLRIERALSGEQVKATKTETHRTVELTPRLTQALDRWQTELEKEALVAGPPRLRMDVHGGGWPPPAR
jgi:integrase